MGLNGVDNGTISFRKCDYSRKYARPFSSVNEKNLKAIPSDNKRFFTMLGTLGGELGFLDRHWLQPNLG
jgi:acyl-CoA oxidase